MSRAGKGLGKEVRGRERRMEDGAVAGLEEAWRRVLEEVWRAKQAGSKGWEGAKIDAGRWGKGEMNVARLQLFRAARRG